MASHQLAIAKASFSAGLLRPDPTSVSRDEITAFHSALDQALSHCSYANIQNCKSWLLNYVVSSSNRVGVWAKYLVALSGSLATDDGKSSKPSNKRKRLHIFYLLNDLFHHTKYHLDSTAVFSTLTGSCQPYIVELLGYAASYDREKNPKHHRRLDDLLNIWAENGYYGADYVSKLREVVKNSAVSGPVKTSIGVEENNTDTASQKQASGKEVPFVMPSTHGDPTTPYYDLPAGNLVPHIIPNSTISLRPESIKPLQFLAGPADEKLVSALKVFMKDVDQIYELEKPEPKDDDEVVDIDELGQTVIRDATTGEIITGETYYGWSRSFCEQMKKRNTKDTRRSRSRSRSWSRSVSRSQTPPRRRRYSDSPESEDGQRLRRSPRSESRSPVGRRGGLGNRRSYSRSASPSTRRQSSRERSYSPPPPTGPRSSFPPPFKRKPFLSAAPPPSAVPPPPPPMHQHGFPPGQFPVPGMALPTPPPNYQGAWPPPPPMPGMPGMMLNPAFPSPFPLQGGGHFPPIHMGGGAPGAPGAPVPLPPGSYHFPPPHSGSGSNLGYQNQQGWGQQGGGRGGGRGWR